MINYRIYAPQGILAQFVRFFWSLEAEVNYCESFVHRALPDNCPELIFYCKGSLSISSPDGEEGRTFSSGIFGQAKKFRQFRTERSFGLFGVYLYPYSLRMLFNLPADPLCNEKVDSETLFGFEGKMLEERIISAVTQEHRVRIASDFFAKRIRSMRDHDTTFACRIQSVIENNDVHSISSFAHHCNLSRRQFERKFREFSGLSPKDFFSIMRFKKALNEIAQGSRSLAQIAIDAGYYDQSHFTNEFKDFSGYTPKTFLLNHQHEVDQRATRDFKE
ncbi:MAG TPA: helix-turn-helix transcriptional regulator [Ohtaekwangia sp.]|nr:helix-turn-helix transcriptional regulator [Ohtaekwangia sp.]